MASDEAIRAAMRSVKNCFMGASFGFARIIRFVVGSGCQGLKPQCGMAGAKAGGLLTEGFGQLEAVAREVVRTAVNALLKNAAGVQGIKDGVGVAGERGLALQLEVGGEGAQAIHLVTHFS